MAATVMATAALARGIGGVVPLDDPPGRLPVRAVARRERRPGVAPGDVVLARAGDRTAEDRPLLALARSAGAEAVVLPAEEGLARWVVAVAGRWAGEPHPARRLRALVSALEAGSLPRRPWGPGGTAVPAVPIRVLARWLSMHWRPCDACRDGGGVRGAACGTCGAPLGAR
jgi:hypothetical protein